ncbi:hypothetical protein J6O48_11575 [bacterium]|nr:hypothetical protein [bacterium]
MKKIIRLLCLVLLMTLVNVGIASAGVSKNFYSYQVKNINIRDLVKAVNSTLDAYQGDDKMTPLENIRNAYVYSDKDSSYFLKFYPANEHTDIFVVSNEKYDVKNNDVTEFLKQSGLEYEKTPDKAALKEYKFDFYKYARKENLGNFYISPDLVKPLKTGMAKLNNHFAKNNKKTSVFPYNNDTDPIDLTCVDTTNYYDENAKISIVQKEYRLKQKENKYVHAHEYIVTNENNLPATVNATSERLASLKDVTTESFVDLDRLDLIDTVGSFPPVLVCTAGTSILCSVPNWIRLARITAESKRFTNALPENYQLNSNGVMRILVLKYKDNPKPINFNIKFSDGTTHKITF